MKKASGKVVIKDKLVSFLYQLMRDHLPCADIEELLVDSMADVEYEYTNGFLARYAENVAQRLR